MIFDVMNLLKGMYFYTFIVIVTSINQRYNSCVFQRYQKKKCIFKIQISQCRLPGFYFLGEMIQIVSSVISFGCTCPYYVLRLIVVKYVCKRCGKLVLFFKAFISIVNTCIYECLNQNAFLWHPRLLWVLLYYFASLRFYSVCTVSRRSPY